MKESLRTQAMTICRDTFLSRVQKLEYLVALNIPVAEARTLLDIYCPKRVRNAFNADLLTFGVEIEALNVDTDLITAKLAERGIIIADEGYNHTDHADHFKFVRDSSLMGFNPKEVVSPILKGQEGEKRLEAVMNVMAETGCTVNRSCGLHVHFDASKFTLKHWQNLLINYYRIERVIDSFMPASRRGSINSFCQSLRGYERFEQTILEAENLAQMQHFFGTRYCKINLEAYNRHRTIEFRQHGGTVSFDKVYHWVKFLRALIQFSKNKSVKPNIDSIEELPFLSAEEKEYFIDRRNQLAAL